MKKLLAALALVFSASASADFVARAGDVVVTFSEAAKCTGKAAKLIPHGMLKDFKGGTLMQGKNVLNLCWADNGPDNFFVVDDNGDMGDAPKSLFKEIHGI